MTEAPEQRHGGLAGRFRHRFWQPPRAHGEIIEDRTVSFLELFYDLVFVVVVARAAHTLAHHISWRGVGDFAVVFGLIWLAWLNGTLYHELHGREDGRSRTFIFMQMTVLAVLGVYTGDAAGDGGTGFAVTYAVLFGVLTWLWYTVRRQDPEEYRSTTDPYIIGMAISTVVIAATATLPDDLRVAVWGSFVVAWIVGVAVNVWTSGGTAAAGVTTTDSMAERFGLFTIIVLGEVVVGVVDGLSEVERDITTIGTGVLALMVGFGFWWTFFDFAGRRLPRDDGVVPVGWVYSHLPAAMAIATAGAAMVGLVEHAGDDHTPEATAWLIGGAVAVFLVSLINTMTTLQPDAKGPGFRRSAIVAMGVGAVLALVAAAWAPAPWILAATLTAPLTAIWFYAVSRALQAGGDQEPLF